MYNPTQFQNADQNQSVIFMTTFPFATLITVADSEPTISHLPLTPVQQGDKTILIGHVATANPHWKIMESADTTCIFHGNHTFITPKWYGENDVPTWNYSVLHAKGRAKIYRSYDQIVEHLKILTNHIEKLWPSGWRFFIPKDLPPPILENSIVAFSIEVNELKFKRKLSQNRSNVDRMGVIRGLNSRHDEQSRGVLADMLTIYNRDGSFISEVEK